MVVITVFSLHIVVLLILVLEGVKYSIDKNLKIHQTFMA